MEKERDIDEILASLDLLLRESESRNDDVDHEPPNAKRSLPQKNDQEKDQASDAQEGLISSDDYEDILDWNEDFDVSEPQAAESDAGASQWDQNESNQAEVSMQWDDEIDADDFDDDAGADESVDNFRKPRVVLTEDMLVDSSQTSLPLNLPAADMSSKSVSLTQTQQNVLPTPQQAEVIHVPQFVMRADAHMETLPCTEEQEEPLREDWDIDALTQQISMAVRDEVLSHLGQQLDNMLPEVVRSALLQQLESPTDIEDVSNDDK